MAKSLESAVKKVKSKTSASKKADEVLKNLSSQNRSVRMDAQIEHTDMNVSEKQINQFQDQTSLMPFIIADQVAADWFRKHAKTKDMPLDDNTWKLQMAMAEHLAKRAVYLYFHNEDFKKKMKASGNKGRDSLYTFMNHWAEAYLGDKKFAEGGSVGLTKEQEDVLSKSYDWLVAVVQKQKRWLSDEDLWTAYPFKKDGLSKHGLGVLIAKTKETLKELEDNFSEGGSADNNQWVVSWKGKKIGEWNHVWDKQTGKKTHWFIDAYENIHTGHIELNVYEENGRPQQLIHYGNGRIGWEIPEIVPQVVKDAAKKIYLANDDQEFSKGGTLHLNHVRDQENHLGMYYFHNCTAFSDELVKKLHDLGTDNGRINMDVVYGYLDGEHLKELVEWIKTQDTNGNCYITEKFSGTKVYDPKDKFENGHWNSGAYAEGGSLHPDHITIIDFSKQFSDISNLDKLPEEIQKLIKRAERVESSGFQGLLGYIGRKLIWEAGGYWNDDKFFIESIGGKIDNEHITWSENKGIVNVTKYAEGGQVPEDLHEGRYIELSVLANGNLKISLTEKGKEWVNENGFITEDNFDELFDDIRGNSDFLYFHNLGEAGLGMSEAQAIADGFYFGDNGDLKNYRDSRLWFFDAYMLEDPFNILSSEGSVVFTKADVEQPDEDIFDTSLAQRVVDAGQEMDGLSVEEAKKLLEVAPYMARNKFFFGGAVSNATLNESLKKVNDHQEANRYQSMFISDSEFKAGGYDKLYRNGYIYDIYKAMKHEVGMTLKGAEFLRAGKKFAKGGIPDVTNFPDHDDSDASMAKGGELKPGTGGDAQHHKSQHWLKDKKFRLEVLHENLETAPFDALLATIRDMPSNYYLASIHKVDGMTYPHYKQYGQLMAAAPQLAWHLQMLLVSHLYWMKKHIDENIEQSAMIVKTKELLALLGITDINEDYVMEFAEGGDLGEVGMAMNTVAYSKGGYTANDGDYSINVHGEEPTDYKIVCKKVRIDGKLVDVCYHETNNKEKKGVEVYSGANYIVGSSDKSYSRAYPLDKYPEKYKSVVEELIQEHSKRFGHGQKYASGGALGDARIPNSEAATCSEHRIPFKGTNLEGKFLDNGDYIVLSFGFYPLWFWCASENQWYGNKDKYNNTAAKQFTQSRPDWSATMLTLHELLDKANQDRQHYDLGGQLVVDLMTPPAINNLGATHDGAPLQQ